MSHFAPAKERGLTALRIANVLKPQFACTYHCQTKKQNHIPDSEEPERELQRNVVLFTQVLTYARLTLPERRQREQTCTVLGVPFTTALTLRTLGFQALLVLR